MTNVINLSKRAFTWSVVVLTILWSVGIAAFVPATALAADVELEAGDLYTVEGDTAVFLVTEDLESMYFPNSDVFFTWFENFDAVNTVSASLPLAETPGVNYRPGSRLVKITTNAKVYAVGPGNMKHWITSEEVARGLYGANWATLVRDVNVFHWSNYSDGADLDAAIPHDGMLFSVAGNAADAGDVYYAWDGMRHMVDGELPAPAAGDVREVSEAVAMALDMGDSVTPAQVLANPSQLDEAGEPAPEEPEEDNTPEPEAPSGDLSFSLSADTPATALVPQSATHVKYLSFNVRAGAEGGLLREVEFKRIGLGDDSNFDKVWLEVAGASVSNEQSVNSDDTVSLRPNYTFGANQMVKFDLVANLAGAANQTSQQDGFEIVSADMVEANGADVDGSFPVRGNIMNYSSYAVASVAMTEEGSDDEVEIGDEQEIVGEFQLAYSSENESDGEFLSIRLKNEGTMNLSDLENLSLYEDGEEISSSVSVWSDYVTFMVDADEQMTEDGEDRRFELRADVVDGEDTETLIFTLEDARDLHVREIGKFGASVDVTNLDGASGVTNSLKTYTLDAGQFTVSLDGSSPANESYAADTEDITAIVARMDLGQDVTVDGLNVYLHTDTTTQGAANTSAATKTAIEADIDRVELYRNDVRVGSSVTALTIANSDVNNDVDADEFYYAFTSSFELSDDDLLTVVIDLESDAVAGNDYKFTLDTGDFDDPEYVQTGENVASGDKSGSATSRFVTIAATELTITRNDGYSAGETFVGGIEDALLMQFVVSAGNASDVRIQTLNFDVQSDNTAYIASNYTKFTNCFISDDDGATAVANESDDMSNTGVLTFNNLRYDIAESDQQELGLYCDLQTGLTATTSFTLDLDVSDSDFDDEEGTDVSSVGSDVSSAALTFATSGILRVGIDGSTADEAIVAANEDGSVDLATYLFQAEDDDIEITNLHFANMNAAGTATSSDDDARVAGYDLVVDGKVIDSAQPSSGAFEFDIDDENSRITVEKDEDVEVTVRVRLNKISEAAQTHANFHLSLTAVEAQSASPGTDLSVQATASVGGVTTTDSGTSVAVTGAAANAPTGVEGNTIVAYRTVPTLAMVTLSGNEDDNEETLGNGESDIFKFKVSADANGDLTWAAVTLEVSGRCNEGLAKCLGNVESDFAIYDSNNDEITALFTTSSGSNASTSARLVIRLATSSIEKIGANSSETYRVEANLQNFTTADTLKINIQDKASSFREASGDLNTIYQLADGGATEGSFVWTDNAGTNGSTSDSHWSTGINLEGLDTRRQEHVFPS